MHTQDGIIRLWGDATALEIRIQYLIDIGRHGEVIQGKLNLSRIVEVPQVYRRPRIILNLLAQLRQKSTLGALPEAFQHLVAPLLQYSIETLSRYTRDQPGIGGPQSVPLQQGPTLLHAHPRWHHSSVGRCNST